MPSVPVVLVSTAAPSTEKSTVAPLTGEPPEVTVAVLHSSSSGRGCAGEVVSATFDGKLTASPPRMTVAVGPGIGMPVSQS